MKLNEVKIMTVIVSIFLITIIWVPFFRGVIISGNENQFLAMGIIGENNDIENYYAKNNTEITLGLENHWNISVTNKMNDIQYLDVKVKILSYQDTLPNSTLLTPSSAAVLYDIPFFLAQGNTIYHEFTWSMDTPTHIAINDENSVEISTNITINNSKYPLKLNLPRLPPITPGQEDFTYSRIVFELWAYNKDQNTFSFIVETPSKEFCIWNQLFFKFNLANLT